MGNLTGEGVPVFDRFTHTYDAYGRLTSTYQGTNGKHEVYTFDVLGRMVEYTNSIDYYNTDRQTDCYTYDSRGR